LESNAIALEIEELEGELSSLRSRVETDNSSFSALESQVAELRERLAETEESVAEHERRLAEKRAALAEAKHMERLSAYSEDLGRQREAGRGVAEAASALLEALEKYDGETVGLRRLAEDMREAFGSDERVAEVEGALADEPEQLVRSWEEIVAAVGWRIRERGEPDDVRLEEADVSEDLQRVAEKRRRTPIMEYFSKS
jgi:predicted  nucleic acid-binding Zn-ribbon protein